MTLKAVGAPHDCLRDLYAGDDKLFVPVENIEVLTRYGSDEAGVAARQAGRRRLAGAQGPRQAAHPRDRRRADQDRRRAAAASRRRRWRRAEGAVRRVLRPLPLCRDRGPGRPPSTTVLDDLRPASRWTGWSAATSASARPRWRCAPPSSPPWPASRWPWSCRRRCSRASTSPPSPSASRACRSRIAQLSRLVGGQGPPRSRTGSTTATSTSSSARMRCSARRSSSSDLGLLIVDEEQHFGVAQKERLKSCASDVHVLTLTATPIPRTLQLALSGVREMSLITTPPVDRLAVRTFVSPFDPVIVREALLRERYRGGQSFYVVPAHRRSRRRARVPARAGAGDASRASRMAAGAERARGRHDRLLRRQVRRAAVDQHHRVRPRHPDRQHPDRAPRRHVRPGAALPAARPHRPLQGARLRLSHHAAGQEADADAPSAASR